MSMIAVVIHLLEARNAHHTRVVSKCEYAALTKILRKELRWPVGEVCLIRMTVVWALLGRLLAIPAFLVGVRTHFRRS